MDITEARALCQRFANDHKIVFEDHGEVGFGRPCVGFTSGSGYIDIHPLDRTDYNELWPHDARLAAPRGVEAYHKHNCLAVLVLGDDDYDSAILQLAQWVEHLEAQGAVEIVSYPTGASGLQAMISGMVGKALRFKVPVPPESIHAR
jgi:hypothetical protein